MTRKAIEKKYGFENPFKPDPLSRKAIQRIPGGGSLLDVGCGEGADSVFFAKKGFSVTSLDVNNEYVGRLRKYCKDEKLGNVAVHRRNISSFSYPRNRYDVIISLLAICCVRRNEAHNILRGIRQAVKPGGIVVLSARNYLDPEMKECCCAGKMVERNTFRREEDCCKYVYFVEKGLLREAFRGFQILHYHEGYGPCKYGEHSKHGDTNIICRRRRGK